MAENQIQSEALRLSVKGRHSQIQAEALRLSVKSRHSEKDLDRLFEYFDELEIAQDLSIDVFAESLLTFG